MKAVAWHGIGDTRLDAVPDPEVEQPTDAVIRLTASAICGTDLHFGRGTCSYCRAGYFAQCDNANPNGPSCAARN